MVSIGVLKDTLAFLELMFFYKILIQPEVFCDFSVLKSKFRNDIHIQHSKLSKKIFAL